MNTPKILRCVLLLAGLPAILSATTLATFDFQSETSGAAPSGSGVLLANTDGDNDVLAVSSSSSPTDPFGGSGNKSIFVHRVSTDSSLPMFQLQIPGFTSAAPLASGTLSFDFYLETVTNGRGSVEVDLGTMATTGGIARQSSFAAFQINASTATTTGQFSYFENTTSGGSITSTTSSAAVATPNAKNTISISWDNTAKTYGIRLNGTSIISSAFTVNGIAGLSSIRFTTVNGTTDINYYIDNVTVTDASSIPEPGTTAAIVGGVGLAVALSARRKANR